MGKYAVKLLFCTCLCGGLAIGCGRKEPSGAVTAARTESREIDPQIMELGPLSQLTANRLTHLAVDSVGNVYWVQETPAGQDILFVAGQDDIPQPTDLTSSSILAALDPSGTSAGGRSGNIQSIAFDSDDNILFFFTGGTGKSIRVCVGQFNPHSHLIRILADTRSLAAAGRMGNSIGIARGQIIRPTTLHSEQPTRYWLWLHHSDAAIFLRFDPHSAERGQQMELSLAFDHLTGDGAPASLTADLLDFSAGADQGLLMVEWRMAMLWRIDENGVATKWMSLLGLPRDLSEVTARPSGIAIAFGPKGEPAVGIEGDGQSVNEGHFLHVQYPALVAITSDDVIATVAAEDIHGPPEVDVSQLRIRQFVPTILSTRWMGYDASSGLLLRIALTPKD